MRLKQILLLVFIVLLNALVSQAQKESPDCFYRHYTGILDTNMRLTMDLYSKNGKITGYYFYSFEIRGMEGDYHYGKTIPLTGTLDGKRIILYEYNNTSSKFSGNMAEDNSIDGTWQRRTYEDPITFALQEDYKVGSIPLLCINKSSVHVLDLPKVPEAARPSARIDLYLLYPPNSVNAQLIQAIDLEMAAFILNDSSSIGDPELVVENITFDYFQSYREATDGIPNIEQTASFDWQKKLSMDVAYNENSILSLRLDKYGYTGGAHGVNITRFRVFDLRKNKPLKLNDLFIKNFDDELNLILEKKLRKLNGVLPEEKLIESGFLVDSIQYNDNFYVNNDGIGFFYNVYEIASYATGTTEIFCSFYELRELLKPDHPFFWTSD